MQATAVVPLPINGSRITPPLYGAVEHKVADDLQGFHRGVMVAHVVLLIAQGDIEGALGVIRAIDLDALFAEEQDVLRIVQIFVAAGWYGVRLVPREQVPVATATGDEIVEVLLYLLLTAEDVDVDALHHAAHLVEHLVRNAVLDVAQPVHALSCATGVVGILRRVFVLRPEAPTLILQLIRRIGHYAVHRCVRHPPHALQAVLIENAVKIHIAYFSVSSFFRTSPALLTGQSGEAVTNDILCGIIMAYS